MGLFDRIVVSTIGKVVGDALQEAVKSNVNEAVNHLTGRTETPASADRPDFLPPQQPTSTNTTVPTGLSSRDGFRLLLASTFPELAVREDIDVASLGGQGKPYDFGLYRDNRLVGVIMLTPHNRDNNRAFKGAKEAAQAIGVPFINFYLHMPNEPGYVEARIRSMVAP